MCFAFKETTTAEDCTLYDILAMSRIRSASNSHHQPSQSKPPASAMTSKSSSGREKSSSVDCIMLDVPPQNKALTKISQGHGSMQRSGSTESDYREDSVDEGDGDANDQSSVGDTSQSVRSKKRQAGSQSTSGVTKKMKTTESSERPAPSGKGEDYDILRDKANRINKRLKADIAQLTRDLESSEKSRDEALGNVTYLENELADRKTNQATKNSKRAADIKAAVQEMKIVLRAEMDKKHKASNMVKEMRHKEDTARVSQAWEDVKVAKQRAKELNPKHSAVLQGLEKKIAAKQVAYDNLMAIAQTTKEESTQLKLRNTSLAKDLDENAAEILKLKAIVTKQHQEMNVQKNAHAVEKKAQSQKWHIQYDNAQASARRASDAARNASTLSMALNASIAKRTELENKLNDAEAELSLLRQSISQGESSK